MARFFVGQRVRVVRSDDESTDHLVGRQAIISEVDDVDWDDGEPFYGLDIFPIQYCPDEGDWCGLNADELEPVIDAHEPCESEFKESLDKLLEGLPA